MLTNTIHLGMKNIKHSNCIKRNVTRFDEKLHVSLLINQCALCQKNADKSITSFMSVSLLCFFFWLISRCNISFIRGGYRLLITLVIIKPRLVLILVLRIITATCDVLNVTPVKHVNREALGTLDQRLRPKIMLFSFVSALYDLMAALLRVYMT